MFKFVYTGCSFMFVGFCAFVAGCGLIQCCFCCTYLWVAAFLLGLVVAFELLSQVVVFSFVWILIYFVLVWFRWLFVVLIDIVLV